MRHQKALPRPSASQQGVPMKSFKPYKPIPPFKVMKPYLLMALPAVVVFCVILFLPRNRISPRSERTLVNYPQIYQERYDQEVTILSQDTTPTSSTTVFSTTATMEEVFAWYDTMYAAHGWVDRLIRPPEEEYRFLDWDYAVDGLCWLGLQVKYTPSTKIYIHRVSLFGKSC
jgi:hypothetical protein